MDGIRHAHADTGPTRADATAPRELVINLTLRCPLKCSHCCFSSDMFQEGHLSLADVNLAITQAARLEGLEIVHFVGGDPFLHTDIMAGAIRHARDIGLGAGATTSAYWAKTPERALAVLAPLVEAGLTELTVSYDDAHAEFVRLSSIDAAVRAALALGVTLRVAVVADPGARLTAAVLRQRLGLAGRPDVKVYETGVNSTGRAAEQGSGTPAERARQDQAYRGHCKSVLRSITVNRDGNIMPCCGVLPHHDTLHIGNIHAGGVGEAVSAAYADPLLKWIAFEGPVAILADVTAADPVPLRPEDFDGICTACDRIFGNPEMLARVRERAREQEGRIALYETVYTAAGLFLPPRRDGEATEAPEAS